MIHKPTPMHERSGSNGGGEYRYGFNGMEEDQEGMGGGLSTYDYGFRIYNTALGKFLSVDPLRTIYPAYSTYQFAANTPISAIDLDGLESKIVIQESGADGTIVIKSIIEYKVEKVISDTYETDEFGVTIYTGGEYSVDNRGPLGEGTYTVTLQLDGTFTESWEPGDGNSVNPFNSTGVSQSRWIDGNQNDAKAMFTLRLNGRLIEKMAEDILFELECDKLPVTRSSMDVSKLRSKIQSDVVVYETDDSKFKGKFAAFSNEEAAFSYTVDWEETGPSDPHASQNAMNSPEFKNSNVILSYYDGAKSISDAIIGHLGLIQEGWFDHGTEALKCLDGDCNLSLDNARTVKSYQEK